MIKPRDNAVLVEEPWYNENTLPGCLENARGDDLEMVLLGTGSFQTSKYRNVTSIRINLLSKGGLLLDCGEGTLGHLKRRPDSPIDNNAVPTVRSLQKVLNEADGMADEVVASNHSTTQEAIEVGNSAGVYRIILTHFSQRYPKIPVFYDIHMHKTCIRFDIMNINIANFPVAPKVLPYLKLLFRDEMIVDEEDELIKAASVAS
ncbi:hypothetical protein C1H46_018951 [Malus baccata]|uniref:ribonuclease Z n=1 Tax=Malus baccata TaxID=106549 RepID=A0A540M9T4_MALBA|nr:hypothetical protein C1H46_018951 [Malus baccata]